MDEVMLLRQIRRLSHGLPKFADGRIDYSTAKTAPILVMFVQVKDKIILLKRNKKVVAYPGKWATIAGFLDELCPIKKKVFEELKEELSIDSKQVKSVIFGSHYYFIDKDIKRRWSVYPVLIKLRKLPRVTIDWEHMEYRWIRPEEIKYFDHVPNVLLSLKRLKSFL
ncbi:MAG: NUDIX domain-containing protein [Nanoarchaeota archaeon]|nr:NUDIX domain-containing protein [Nanoarchaeota archaeon]